MRLLLTVLALLFASGCGAIRDHRLVVQPLNTTLTASVGATLFHMNRKGDLPNAYGARDVLGGKVDKGFATVRLKGIRDERFVELLAVDVAKDSNETTLNRLQPFNQALVNVDVSQTVNIGSFEGGIVAVVDTSREKEYVLDGIRIRFLEVRPSSVVYVLEDTNVASR